MTAGLARLLAAACLSCATTHAADGAARPAPVGDVTRSRAAPPELVALPVDGFHAALVSVPAGDAPRPVLVATHGAGGTAEEQCAAWRARIAHRGFVLCPNGTPLSNARDAGPAAYYTNHHALEKELYAALAALHRRFSNALSGRYVYAGFSQGAIMGALVVMQHPDDFPRLVLVEGGGSDWNVASARRLAHAGDAHVLFVCGVSECQRRAADSARWLHGAGVAVRVEHVVGGGHTDGGEVGERVDAALGWLLQGDARWR